MGGAIAEGLLRVPGFCHSDLCVSNPTAAKLEPFARLGARVTTSNTEAVHDADIINVVVKPWIVKTVLEEIKPRLDYSRQLLVIVAAGVSAADISTWLDKEGEKPRFFLGMPNIAIAVRASMTFIVPVNATADDTALVKALFDSMGRCLVTEERLLPAATRLASCGIAYALRYVRAASEGGVELGFKADAAKDIVLQTVRGAVELLQASGEHPEAAIDKVTTPGGMTIRGLNAMEHAGFTSAVIKGLKA